MLQALVVRKFNSEPKAFATAHFQLAMLLMFFATTEPAVEARYKCVISSSDTMYNVAYLVARIERSQIVL